MADAPRDSNRVPSLVAKSDADNTAVVIEADPVTKRLKVNTTLTGVATNTVSTVNSTTVALGGGAVFTGTSEDVSAYADIRVSVFADQVSATDGLNLQQSSNGTNWDNTDTYTIPISTGKAFDVPVYSKFFRIVYTNGPTPQGAFRLQTVYHVYRTKPTSQRPQDARTNDNDMEENISYAALFNAVTWDRVRSIINATNSVGTGIQAVGLIGQFDDTLPTAITENQFGNLRMSANRNLYNTIRDAAGNERGANVTASNELVVSDSGLRPAGTALNTYSVHITTNATTTPTAATAYVSSIAISSEIAGTTSTVTIQDKQGTPLKLINGFSTTSLTTVPTVVNFQTPVRMVSGIDIITAGAVAATVDVWVNYYQ